MVGVNTYIQQISFNGISYTKGTVVDPLQSFHIIAKDFPFKIYPEPKDLPTRDWIGEDGLDVYIPDVLPMKQYDIEVTFLYSRERTQQVTDETIRAEMTAFIEFIYGREKGAQSDSVKSARLAIYNEYTGIGRKDVVVTGISNDVFFLNESDNDVVAEFKVKFSVYDPVTKVTKSGNNLVWS